MRNGEIVAHRSFVVSAEQIVDAVPFFGFKRSVQVSDLSGRPTESFVEVRNEHILKETVRFGYGRDILKTQLLDEPILKRSEEPLDPAFGLGRIGEDDIDAKILHDAGDLRFHIRVFSQGFLIHFIGLELIDIDRLRKAVFIGVFLPKGQHWQDAFVFFDREMNNVPGGVVDGRKEALFACDAILEPFMI